jgi:hypothetical protein
LRQPYTDFAAVLPILIYNPTYYEYVLDKYTTFPLDHIVLSNSLVVYR